MKKSVVLAILILGIVSFSCTTRLAKLERSNDFEELYKGAVAFYEQGKYGKAKVLFERISPYYRGSVEAEKVQFYWAYCEYYQRLYTLSAFRFKNFYTTYGRSPLAEEAEFMHAYSLYKSAPDANLDQTSSEEAVLAMQNFLNRRPASQYYVQANDIINELQVRFETKAYETAKLYHKLTTGLSYRNYLEAALITFEAFKSDFPDSKFNEELMYLTVETSYKLAENSIQRRRKERFTKTLEYYQDFVDRFPQSQYTAEVTDWFTKSKKELEILNKVD